MSLKKMLAVNLVIIIFVFSLMLTTSYAWYAFNNASTTFSTITSSGLIEISYLTGEYINTNNAIPLQTNEIEKYADKAKFNIISKNKNTDDELYATISLYDINIDKSLQNVNFKVELYNQNQKLSTVSGNTIGTNNNTTKELSKLVLDDNITNSFEVRAYILNDNSDQTNLMNKTFRAKIKIDVVSRKKIKIEREDYDIYVSNITIDGNESNDLPRNGLYNMTSSCEKGSNLSWNTYSKTITYNNGSKIGDKCSLTFTTNQAKVLLNTLPIGSYVKYEGTGGTVKNTKIACKKNGSQSSAVDNDETESPNSCLGQNAREDLDNSNYTYGYCSRYYYKYYTTGWRIAYILNNKAMLISAGSPECATRTPSTANESFIKKSNTLALKYCNTNYVDGNCSCTDSNNDSLCDSPSTDAWTINDTDFYYITKAISGYGKRLTNGSSSLGDSGGALSSLYCHDNYGNKECGYNNDLLDNGSYYWFASQRSSDTDNGIYWHPRVRNAGTDVSTLSYGIRPIISMSSSVYVTGGSGTMSDPFTISN